MVIPRYSTITAPSGKVGYVLGQDATNVYVRSGGIQIVPLSSVYRVGDLFPESERLPEDNGSERGFDLPASTPVFRGGSRRRHRLKRKTSKRR
jgi:hypothetical protein